MYAATAMNHNQHCRRVVKRKRKTSKLFTMILVLSIVTIVVFSMYKTAQAEETVSLNKYYKTITVEPDDTLWNLAEEYSYGSEDSTFKIVNEIMSINHIGSTITSGMKIIIPYYAE